MGMTASARRMNAPAPKNPRLLASLAKLERICAEVKSKQPAADVPRESPADSSAAAVPPISAAAPQSAPPPGPQENPGEGALALAWTQQRWGMTRRLVSSRVGGAIYTITREDYDDGVAYHAWRSSKPFITEIGTGFYSSHEATQEQALAAAKSACAADALRRIGRE